MEYLPQYQRVVYKLLHFFRLTTLARLCNRSRVMILCYHGISERVNLDPEDRSQILVTRSLFMSHLQYLMRYYRVISLRDYIEARQTGRQLHPHSVVLTFDDALRNFLTVAAPVLNELHLPATLFMVTDWANRRGESILDRRWAIADDRTSLSWSEAAALASSQGIECGSHTCSHLALPDLPIAEAERELSDSYYEMRKGLVEYAVPFLAYPYGAYSDAIANKAREVGYLCALTTDPGSNSRNTDLFRLRRAVVRRFDTIEVFAARVSGIVGWLRTSRHILRSLLMPVVHIWKSSISHAPPC